MYRGYISLPHLPTEGFTLHQFCLINGLCFIFTYANIWFHTSSVESHVQGLRFTFTFERAGFTLHQLFQMYMGLICFNFTTKTNGFTLHLLCMM